MYQFNNVTIILLGKPKNWYIDTLVYWYIIISIITFYIDFRK
jgi:hypothetical protein